MLIVYILIVQYVHPQLKGQWITECWHQFFWHHRCSQGNCSQKYVRNENTLEGLPRFVAPAFCV